MSSKIGTMDIKRRITAAQKRVQKKIDQSFDDLSVKVANEFAAAKAASYRLNNK